VLGVLIFIHEFGHFLVARLFGVGVEKFSLGFGPRIFGKKVGITDYRISAIPLGGYVKMVGEEPDAELEPEQIPISFTHKHVLKRMCIVFAGPFFNVLLAVVIYFGFLAVSGTSFLLPAIGEVSPDTPAMKAGLQRDDVIKAINGEAVESWREMASRIMESESRPLLIVVQREGELIDMTITPELRTSKNIFGEDIERHVIGIRPSGASASKDLSLPEAALESVARTYRVGELTVLTIIKLFQGRISMENLGGPLMIGKIAGQQAREGALSLVFFIAFISVNLAILNVLPIPVLDGGHLLFFFIELVIGRPVHIRIREVAQQVGLFLLLLLMVFVFYNDIVHIFLKSEGGAP
ncbi:MAG: RIP metalloprotease RseP, partial [Desulfobacterales bacterium]|nr:RIP metalloprotease RseP [Desulfobacterales bacterium]